MKTDVHFITLEPQDPLVAKHIAYYYFYKNDSADFYKAFTYYPHYMNALSIDRDSEVSWDHCSRTSSYKQGTTDHIITVNPRETRRSELIGKMNRICIAFHPFGLNQFVEIPLSDLAPATITASPYFGKSLIDCTESVFATNDNGMKVQLLDAYFRQQYTPCDEPRLEKAIQFVLEANHKIETHILAEMVGASRKTLLRLFKKHLCCTPKEFASVVQFRKAFHQYKRTSMKLKFSDVAYDNGYCDQSGFNRQIMNLTGSRPSPLFKETQQIGSQPIYWTMSA